MSQHVYLVGVVLVIYLVKMPKNSMDQIKLACVLSMQLYQVAYSAVLLIDLAGKNFVLTTILKKIQMISLLHVFLAVVPIAKKQEN